MDISPSYSHYMARRSCFAKRFPKRIKLPHRIRSTSTDTAGAATTTAGALPNAPLKVPVALRQTITEFDPKLERISRVLGRAFTC
jgi:hypothetical protein